MKTRDSYQPENACEPSAHIGNENRQDTSTNEEEVDDDDDASTISNVGNCSGEVSNNSKCFSVKKRATKRRKTEQMEKTLELLQATIENGPTKELGQMLEEDMKHSREQEMRLPYLHLMCSYVWSITTQWPSKYATSWTVMLTFTAVQIQIIFTIKVIILHNSLRPFQELLVVVVQAPHHMGIHHLLHASVPTILSNSYSDERSVLYHVQSTMASQGQSGIPQFEQ